MICKIVKITQITKVTNKLIEKNSDGIWQVAVNWQIFNISAQQVLNIDMKGSVQWVMCDIFKRSVQWIMCIMHIIISSSLT